ncbi:hypothetical protein DH2020_031973 [Rehmannia glutinosa]|uniref:DUF1685 family protein n=1 Tax=Rehmannia glutinosa TaxID=99300 RepID=A0ABR0VI82_REHGL
MSDEQTIILNLFDSYWFEYGVFTPKPPLSTTPKTTSVVQEEEDQEADDDYKLKLNRITTLMRRSYSDDQLLTSKTLNSPSPKSVLGPQLQTILSGKQVECFEEFSSKKHQEKMNPCINNTNSCCGSSIYDTRKKRRKNRSSRSMSELELEELKGFMDLGFVFSDHEEQIDSRLVSIIPGLQRVQGKLGFGEAASYSVSRRPYLSEAWDFNLEQVKINNNPLMDWRIPEFGNDMELKDNIRLWAHTVVASTVR